MAKGDWSLTFERAGPLAGDGADPAGVVFEEAARAVGDIVEMIHARAAAGTPRGATGALRGSIVSEVRGSALDSLRGTVATPLAYALPVEEGRGPGRRPPSGPGSSLYGWVERVLGVSGGEARSAAFLIARAIGRRGTAGRHMFRDALEKSMGPIARRVERLGADIAGRLRG